MFPGQGSQYIGMGKEFYEQIPICKEVSDRASEVTGLDIPALCYLRKSNYMASLCNLRNNEKNLEWH